MGTPFKKYSFFVFFNRNHSIALSSGVWTLGLLALHKRFLLKGGGKIVRKRRNRKGGEKRNLREEFSLLSRALNRTLVYACCF